MSEEDECDSACGYRLKRMAGSSNQASFSIYRQSTKSTWAMGTEKYPALVMHGTCFGSTVVLGVGHAQRTEFDLHHPDSISKIEAFIRAEIGWRRANK